MIMKKISIVTACYNEEENVGALYKEVKSIMSKSLKNYSYEHLFIDNCSGDKTVDILRKIAKEDKNVKVIVNSRNFGHVRSPVYGLLQANGDAIISLVADFQDPPELIVDLVKKWEEGNDTVLAIKKKLKTELMPILKSDERVNQALKIDREFLKAIRVEMMRRKGFRS